MPPAPSLSADPALVTVAAWLLGAGRPYGRNPALDCSEWLYFAMFVDAFASQPGPRAESIGLWVDTACDQAEELGLVEWHSPYRPRRLTPAGQTLLAGHGELARDVAARLTFLAGHLPLADRFRTTLWFNLCGKWLLCEEQAGRLTGPELLALLPPAQAWGVSPGQLAAVTQNLDRLRAAVESASQSAKEPHVHHA